MEDFIIYINYDNNKKLTIYLVYCTSECKIMDTMYLKKEIKK